MSLGEFIYMGVLVPLKIWFLLFLIVCMCVLCAREGRYLRSLEKVLDLLELKLQVGCL